MPFGVVSGIGRGIGVLDGSGDRRRERGSFSGKCGASHCNQTLCVRGGDVALLKLIWDFLLFVGKCIFVTDFVLSEG